MQSFPRAMVNAEGGFGRMSGRGGAPRHFLPPRACDRGFSGTWGYRYGWQIRPAYLGAGGAWVPLKVFHWISGPRAVRRSPAGWSHFACGAGRQQSASFARVCAHAILLRRAWVRAEGGFRKALGVGAPGSAGSWRHGAIGMGGKFDQLPWELGVLGFP